MLPSAPVITDNSGVVVRGVIGPYLEGGRLVLTCKAKGGKMLTHLMFIYVVGTEFIYIFFYNTKRDN